VTATPDRDTRPPRIGVSACFFHADPTRAIFKGKTLLYAEESMLDLLGRGGALAYLLPRATSGGPTVEEYVADLDGLLLEGGSDVSPQSYGEVAERADWEGDHERDEYEIALIHAFVGAGRPVLGICRGVQILNVAFGGTLYQDIATQRPGAGCHRDWERYDANTHAVELTPGSRLASLYAPASGSGPGPVTVNSVHHQAIKDLADGFEVEARSVPEGLVEAIRRPGPAYLAGVQWHPEFTPRPPTGQISPEPLVDDFLAAARNGRSAR
jgi:putative glutamine amidotransferase